MTDPVPWTAETAARAEDVVKTAVVREESVAVLQLLREAEHNESLRAFLMHRGARRFVEEFYQRQNQPGG